MHPPIPLLERLREFDGGVDDFYAAGLGRRVSSAPLGTRYYFRVSRRR
ncbi:hypothetical protein [Streptomyces cyaneofuscatus]